MQKIYKRGLLENRFAIAFVLSSSFATTSCVALVLLGIAAYWPAAVILATSLGVAYSRTRMPYEIAIGTGKAAGLLIMNLFVLCVSVLVL